MWHREFDWIAPGRDASSNADRLMALIDLAVAWKKLADRHGSTFTPTPRCRLRPTPLG